MPSVVDRFFRNRETGEVVIAQRPNLPLVIFLVATAVRVLLHPHGTAGTATSVAGTAGLGWWSAEEILRGDSPFRRVLGAVVLLGLLARLLAR